VTYVVEVNEGVVEASRQGCDWWQLHRPRFVASGKLREMKAACIVGGVVELDCDDKETADFMAAHMIGHGMPRNAVRVKKRQPTK
jgi:hypothetical protein